MKVENTFNSKMVEQKMKATLGLYADTAAKKLEAEGKRNAPWTDRTSNARNSIQGNSRWEGEQLVIFLSGNVNYFIYLELAMEKKYSILVPTIEKNANEILRGFKKLVE